MTAATLEPPFTIEEIAKRPLTIDEVANVYARPISFVHAWLASGRLALNGDGLLPWRDVVSAHCGVPCVDLEHPDDKSAAREARQRRVWSGPVVYFVSAPTARLVKIGKAETLARRLRALRTMSPIPLVLIALAPGGGAEESSLHREFAEDRAHGEWFRATPRLLAGAKASRNLYGLPEWAT